MFFSTRHCPSTTGTDRARYKLDRQRVNYLGIWTHLADARCHADISRSYNCRISSMEDVIIIGGGPVGFVNALGLAQAGVRVSVIEAEPHIINSPRAAVYFWSVLGGFNEDRVSGFRDEFLAQTRMDCPEGSGALAGEWWYLRLLPGAGS